MRIILIILSLLFALSSNAQPVCCATLDSCLGVTLDSIFHKKDSINNVKYRKEDSTFIVEGTIGFFRSGGINHPALLDHDGDHEPFGVKDSVVLDGWDLNIYFKRQARRISSFYCGVDETMQGSASAVDTNQAYVMGGYLIGARVFGNYATIRISKVMQVQAVITYDSTSDAFSVQQCFPAPFNINSPALKITYGTDNKGYLYIDVKTDKNFLANGYARVTSSAFDNNSLYNAHEQAVSRTWTRIYFSNHNGIISGTKPREHTQFLIDFGSTFGRVDWLTEDFGGSSNFSFHGLFKF
jgi:hypothetical protein